MSVCAICLRNVAEEDEAFVEGCLHRFCLSCISKWSGTQLDKDKTVKSLACPLCKQPYTSVFYDCRSTCFRRKEYIKGAAFTAAGGSSDFQPSADQLRRRSLYYSTAHASSNRQGILRVSCAACDRKWLCQTSAGHHPSRRSAGPAEAKLALLSRPGVSAWIDRELQAVLLDDDVNTVAQHILGSLRAAFQASATRGPGLGQANIVSRDKCLEVTAAAAAAYLQESAAQFAAELWSFVASGLSIQAQDRTVFGAQQSTSRQHNAGMPMNGEEQDKEEGELSREEPQRRASDEAQLSLSYHSGGYGSEDSEAYIPLLKSALQGDVTSRGAEDAPSHTIRGYQNIGDASHSVGASSKPAQEGTQACEAARSVGSAIVVDHSAGADSHAGGGAEAIKELEVGMEGGQQQPAGESMQLLGSIADDVEARAVQASAKKRKGKGKKGRHRASKRQARSDGRAEAAAEQDQDLESPGARPGSHKKQSLSDLREAALMWAQKTMAAAPEKDEKAQHWRSDLRD